MVCVAMYVCMKRVVWWLDRGTVVRENGGLCSYVCMKRVSGG